MVVGDHPDWLLPPQYYPVFATTELHSHSAAPDSESSTIILNPPAGQRVRVFAACLTLSSAFIGDAAAGSVRADAFIEGVSLGAAYAAASIFRRYTAASPDGGELSTGWSPLSGPGIPLGSDEDLILRIAHTVVVGTAPGGWRSVAQASIMASFEDVP